MEKHARNIPKFCGFVVAMVAQFSQKSTRKIIAYDFHISKENAKFMSEMIALQALCTVKQFDLKVADKYYIGLIKDLHHMGEVGYIVSAGYDVIQKAICFLYRFIGKRL